ncbi:MAG: hypothetical protein R3F34_00455 [Planctomycetota bacterium]
MSALGLEAGRLHEFCGAGAGSDWAPPLALAVHLARGSLGLGERGGDHAVWIGRRVWPYPAALAGADVRIARGAAGVEYGIELFDEDEEDALDGDALEGDARAADPLALFEHSLFVDARGTAGGANGSGELLWAADRALRCSKVGVVVLDGSRLPKSAMRRLQLAAEAGGALGIVLRPANEASQLSAAASRFSVERCSGLDGGVEAGWPARWSVTPLRRRSGGLVRFGASAAAEGFGAHGASLSSDSGADGGPSSGGPSNGDPSNGDARRA